MSLSNLGDQGWVQKHEDELKALFPEVWTHVSNLNLLSIGFKLKALGIDWREWDDLPKIMTFLCKIRFLLMDGPLVKRNPNRVIWSK